MEQNEGENIRECVNIIASIDSVCGCYPLNSKAMEEVRKVTVLALERMLETSTFRSHWKFFVASAWKQYKLLKRAEKIADTVGSDDGLLMFIDSPDVSEKILKTLHSLANLDQNQGYDYYCSFS